MNQPLTYGTSSNRIRSLHSLHSSVLSNTAQQAMQRSGSFKQLSQGEKITSLSINSTEALHKGEDGP